MELEIILTVLSSVLFGINLWLQHKKSSVELQASVKEQALALFLYAEKQTSLSNNDKMEYVAKAIVNVIDDAVLKVVIGKLPIKVYLQSLYDEFKQSLIK